MRNLASAETDKSTARIECWNDSEDKKSTNRRPWIQTV